MKTTVEVIEAIHQDLDKLKVNGRYMSDVAHVSGDLRAMKVAIDGRLAGSKLLGSWKSGEDIADWIECAIASLDELHYFFSALEKRLTDAEGEILDTETEQTQSEMDKEAGQSLDRRR